VMISHMRGKLADMDAVAAACERHEAVLLEDCAHSLGVYWQGKHSGHAGVWVCVWVCGWVWVWVWCVCVI